MLSLIDKTDHCLQKPNKAAGHLIYNRLLKEIQSLPLRIHSSVVRMFKRIKMRHT